MKILKRVLFVILVLIIVAVGIVAYYGGFNKIVITRGKEGGETLIYEEVTGDYSQTGFIADKIYNSLLNEDKIETTKGFGIFHDNPQYVEQNKLRSDVGCILDAPVDSLKMAELSKKYRVKILPETNCITIEFPFKGKMSIMVGIFRVYPEIEKYIKENNLEEAGPVMEIYDIPNQKIIYRKEIKEN